MTLCYLIVEFLRVQKLVEIIKTMTEDKIIGASTQAVLGSIGNITQAMENVFVKYNERKDEKLYEDFDKLIKMNHYLLQAVNLSNYEINEIIRICESYKFTAKLTGAGNGGYCVCFVRKDQDNAEKIQTFLKELEAHKFYAMRCDFTNRGIEQVV